MLDNISWNNIWEFLPPHHPDSMGSRRIYTINDLRKELYGNMSFKDSVYEHIRTYWGKLRSKNYKTLHTTRITPDKSYIC